MFERFSDTARRAIVLSQEEARLLGHDYIGTEHLLLGLMAQDGAAAAVLRAMDIDLASMRRRVDAIIGKGDREPSGHIPFTPRAKKVLEQSLRESLQLRHNYIGPEHLLLALVHESDGVAAQVLTAAGADAARVRKATLETLATAPPRQDVAPSVEDQLRAQIAVLESRVAELERRLGESDSGTGDVGT